MWPWKSKTERLLELVLSNQTAIMKNQAAMLRGQAAALQGQAVIKQNQARLGSNQQHILDHIDGRFGEMEALLFDLLLCGKPGPVRIVVTGESEMADVLEFKVVLPERSAPDVTSRDLTVQVGDAEAQGQSVPVDQTEVTGLKGPENAEVKVSLVDIDNAGNRSEPRTATATLLDTIAPPQPGALGLVVTGETHVEDEEPGDEEPGPQGPGPQA